MYKYGKNEGAKFNNLLKFTFQERLDLPVLQKRPFCNAFTGCGRKRSNQRDIGEFLSRNRQNKLYALWQQKMAEIEALKSLLEEVSFDLTDFKTRNRKMKRYN